MWGDEIVRGASEWHLGERRKDQGGRGGEGGAPRGMREDKGGVFTPILTFPPQGGREGKEGAHEGRPCGERGSALGGGNGAQ